MEKHFENRNVTIRNIRDVVDEGDGSYLCKLDLKVGDEPWETVDYGAVPGDTMDTGQWVLAQIQNGIADNTIIPQSKADFEARPRDPEALMRHVDTVRDRIMKNNVSVDFRGKTILVDVRHPASFNALLGRISAAQIHQSRGNNKPFKYRGVGNETHVLSPQEMLQMGQTILDAVNQIDEASWAIKDDIVAGTITTFPEIEDPLRWP